MSDQPAIADFKLSITKALADQLDETLERLKPAPLTLEQLGHVQARPGIYVLFLNQEKIYVGKAARSLAVRLVKHQRKLSGRVGLDLASLSFVCAYVDEDLDAAAPEKILLKRYRVQGSVPWNTNGFGNNDPGRNRDASHVSATHFDALYPINLDLPLELAIGGYRVSTLLEQVKGRLPYNLRYETTNEAYKNLRATSVVVERSEITVRELLVPLVTALPAGWQATALPGYLILYKEQRRYPSALSWWRQTATGTAIETAGPRTFDESPPSEPESDPDDE